MEVIARIEKYLLHHEPYARLESDMAILVARAKVAFTDPLTGVANRAGLIAEWPTLCACGPTVVVLDLDRFKPVNDRYGHAAGDQVLIEVAVRLRLSGGRVVRLGGDEFAIILPHSLVRAVALMRHLAEQVAEPIRLASGDEISVSMSAGLHRALNAELKLMLACADAAMYRAKAMRIGVAAFNPHCDGRPVEERPAVRLRDTQPTIP